MKSANSELKLVLAVLGQTFDDVPGRGAGIHGNKHLDRFKNAHRYPLNPGGIAL